MPYKKTLKTLLFALIIALPLQSKAEISLNVSIGEPVAVAPPPLPVYVVPEPPEQDFVWAPGHWQWGGYGYFWVPGTWIEPPQAGLLWTPGYWAYDQDQFFFHEGYWGPHVGFYGGINYGGGYDGRGFNGGGWHGDHYEVNRSVTNVTNINNVTINNYHQSFNGGPGGITARPTTQQQSFDRENHYPPTEQQVEHRDAALNDPQLRQESNHGRPPIAASARPADFSGRGVVAAREAGRVNPAAEKYNRSVISNPSLARGAALPNTGNFSERRNAEVNRQPVPNTNQFPARSEVNQPARSAEPPVAQRALTNQQPQLHENTSSAYTPHSRPEDLPQHHQSARYAQPRAPQQERPREENHQPEQRNDRNNKERPQP